MGEILRTRILSEGGGWAVYTTDNVHPRDNGYAIYGDAVTAYLSEQLTKPSDGDLTAPTPRSLPAPLIAQSRENAHLEDAAAYASDGWTVVEQSLCGRYPRYIEADKPGTALTFRFSGKRVGLYMMRAKDSGDIRYAIDGGEEQALSTWDHYCKQFNRAASVLLCGELPQGEHTVTITVSGTKAEESEGTAIRIGAFMVY